MPNHFNAPSTLRGLWRWLLLAPAVLLLLLWAGELALLNVVSVTTVEVRSMLQADYKPWTDEVFAPLDAAIIEAARQDSDAPAPDESFLVAGDPWLAWDSAGEHDPATGTPMPLAATSEPEEVASTAEPATSTPTAPASPTVVHTNTAQPTHTVTSSPTVTRTPIPTTSRTNTPTETPSPTATATSLPPPSDTSTATPVPPEIPSPTATPSHTPTASDTPSPTPAWTSTPTASETPTVTLTPSATSTPTDTPTPSDTPTPTVTLTATSTPTNTPVPCSGSTPGGEPNLGAPNGTIYEVPCGTYLIVDLGASNQINAAHAGADLVYYERPAGPGIYLDWVIVDVCTDATCSTTYTIFNWGDGAPDVNTNVAGYSGDGDGEADNEAIPSGSLYAATGVAIDISGIVPPGTYQYVRFFAPLGGDNDGADVDALEVLP